MRIRYKLRCLAAKPLSSGRKLLYLSSSYRPVESSFDVQGVRLRIAISDGPAGSIPALAHRLAIFSRRPENSNFRISRFEKEVYPVFLPPNEVRR